MKTILHADANNFYASVECILDPTLKGKAVAVSGNPEKRHGIILAKNELAKSFGVKTGDVIWQAKQKCPDLILLAPQHNEYMKYSKQLREIYCSYTDRVESFGIDECWLDVTSSYKLFGSGEKIANELREKVKNQLGITISVGVSFNKIFAKLGSDLKKPDATTLITSENFKEKIWDLPASDMLMVGRKTSIKLKNIGINTIGDLANSNIDALKKVFGINGVKFYDYANGKCEDEVMFYYESEIPKSVGNSTTMPKDITTREEAQSVIMALSEMVATRLRRGGFVASGIHVSIKTNDLDYCAKQTKLNFATSNASQICDGAMYIYDILKKLVSLPIRALSVSTFYLSHEQDCVQLSLFEDDDKSEKLAKIDSSIDLLRKKYGYNVVQSCAVVAEPFICNDLEETEFIPFKGYDILN